MEFQIPADHAHGPVSPGTDADNDIARSTFFSVWPNQRELDIIFGDSIHKLCSLYPLIGTFGGSKMDCQQQKPSSIEQVLQSPRPKSNPAAYARSLLLLAVCLQGSDIGQNYAPSNLIFDHQDVISRAVTSAHKILGHEADNETETSLEGIMCLILESMYHCFEGNLQKAWHTHRQAMLMAQLKGLHKQTDPITGHAKEYDYHHISHHLWFEMINIDSYYCMILGLPQGSGQSRYPLSLDSSKPITADPQTRLRQVHCMVAGRILDRHHLGPEGRAETMEMDKMLQNAAGWMPPRWWLDPTKSCYESKTFSGIEESGRIRDQLMHYHLLIQLHWPYMLVQTAKHEFRYSCMSAMNASRELLARFVALNMHRTTRYYCLGASMLAIAASTALCISYIKVGKDGEIGGLMDHILHHRPADRGMMEVSLESIKQLSLTRTHPSVVKMISVFRDILSVEEEVARGTSYKTVYTGNHTHNFECYSRRDDERVQIYIPSLGSIDLVRQHGSQNTAITSSPAMSNIADSGRPSDNGTAPFPGATTNGNQHQDIMDLEVCLNDTILDFDQQFHDEWLVDDVDGSLLDYIDWGISSRSRSGI
ncbi:unnamed protein product [Clonostachys rhizophaga]|uniref:Xylanolytic transcriptional activator regulatory domain-containing protein n=1 Tax=Clonostachys rhizophaga TaxID=160324 RepID=A0A9N9VRE9_9HYPO|nr:unnamed protein product [Clonostachys rhizophaga]